MGVVIRSYEEIMARIEEHKQFKQRALDLMVTNPEKTIACGIACSIAENEIEELEWVLGKETERRAV